MPPLSLLDGRAVDVLLLTGKLCFRRLTEAIRRIFSLVDMITKANFSNSPNDFKIRLFG